MISLRTRSYTLIDPRTQELNCYRLLVTSPATVRLMGLLVIVAMVAGCGEETGWRACDHGA